MKNKKGFTLVEMLVTITILGLISVISIPLARGLQDLIRTNKLNSYEETLIQGAKLYVGSKSIDLFGYDDSGCAKLTYQDIRNSNMIEEIPFDKEFGYDKNKVFVEIRKNKDKYTYKVYYNGEDYCR